MGRHPKRVRLTAWRETGRSANTNQGEPVGRGPKRKRASNLNSDGLTYPSSASPTFSGNGLQL